MPRVEEPTSDYDRRQLEERASRLSGGEALITVGASIEAATDEFGDLFTMGVIDPTKVTRLGLQNAASIASLILTTAGIIAVDQARSRAGPDVATMTSLNFPLRLSGAGW